MKQEKTACSDGQARRKGLWAPPGGLACGQRAGQAAGRRIWPMSVWGTTPGGGGLDCCVCSEERNIGVRGLASGRPGAELATQLHSAWNPGKEGGAARCLFNLRARPTGLWVPGAARSRMVSVQDPREWGDHAVSKGTFETGWRGRGERA